MSVRRTLIVTIVMLGMTITGVAPAAADGGLVVRNETTYTVVPEEYVVRVESVYTLTNVKASTRSGNRITSYYYDQLTTVIPLVAKNITAATSGGELRYDVDPIDDESSFGVLEMHLRSKLNYNKTLTITLTYDLPGTTAAPEESLRVNPAFASFPVFAVGDSGKSTVTIRLPDSFNYSLEGLQIDDLDITVEDGFHTITATAIEEPAFWFGYVIASNNDALATEELTVAGVDLRLLHWPGDNQWVLNITKTIEENFGTLVETIGIEPDLEGTLEIAEQFTPTLYGYAGWYIIAEERIEVSEDADTHIILHELSHVWFNDTLFASRWINEGLAEVFAARANPDSDPPDIDEPVANSLLAVELNSWRFPTEFDLATFHREGWAYDTSTYVMDLIADEIGFEGLGAVIEAADLNHIAYQGAGDPELVRERDDWRRFLDLVEEVGGSADAGPLFKKYVTSPGQDPWLADRAEAREAYDALAERSGWAAPLIIREPMSDWDFDEAQAAITSAHELLDTFDQVSARAAEMSVDLPQINRTVYETSEQPFVDGAELAQRQLEGARAVLDAQTSMSADRGWLTKLGLYRNDDLDSSLASAKTAWASDDPDATLRAVSAVMSILDAAPKAGRNRAIFGTTGLLLVIGLLTTSVVFLKRRVPTTVVQRGQDQGRQNQVIPAEVAQTTVADLYGLGPDPFDGSPPIGMQGPDPDRSATGDPGSG